jgi:flagellar hook-length control protein FliK
MLDAILPAAAPKATPATKAAGQKADPDGASRFGSVYGRAPSGPEGRAKDHDGDNPEREGAESHAKLEPASKVTRHDMRPITFATDDATQASNPETQPVEAADQETDTTPTVLPDPISQDEPQPDEALDKALSSDAKTNIAHPVPERPIATNGAAEEAVEDTLATPRVAPAESGGNTNTASDEGNDRPREQPTIRPESGPPQSEARTERGSATGNGPDTAPPSPRAIEMSVPRAAEAAQPITPAVDPAPTVSVASSGSQAAAPVQGTASANAMAPAAATVVEQLTVAVKQSHDGRVELTLSPAELGRVRMTLLTGEIGITVAIRADRDDTLDLFRRNSEALAQEFRQMGYGSVGFEFSSGGRSGQPQDHDDETDVIAEAEPASRLPDGILRLTGLGSLDIRL